MRIDLNLAILFSKRKLGLTVWSTSWKWRWTLPMNESYFFILISKKQVRLKSFSYLKFISLTPKNLYCQLAHFFMSNFYKFVSSLSIFFLFFYVGMCFLIKFSSLFFSASIIFSRKLFNSSIFCRAQRIDQTQKQMNRFQFLRCFSRNGLTIFASFQTVFFVQNHKVMV